jgi:hypothetical protein
MKDKIIAVLAILLAVAVFSSVLMYKLSANEKQARKTAENNVKVLEQDSRTYKTKSGQLAVEVEALQYTLAEVKRYRQKDLQRIAEMDIKLKRVQSVQNTEVNTVIKYQTVVKDSLIHDTVAQCFVDRSPWHTLEGCVLNGEIQGTFEHRDTVTTVGQPTYRGWWIFRKVNGAKITTTNSSKYGTVVGNEYILFK